MDFFEHEQEQRFREVWRQVRIERPVQYSLFTFGYSDLDYFLVCSSQRHGEMVSIRRGNVRVSRATILTPDNFSPEFENFFENQEEQGLANFLLARTAGFSHLKFQNQSGPHKIVSDSVEEAVDRLNRQLDVEEEDRVAILSSPVELRGLAVFKYAVERIWASTPDNLQELRERGFLP